MVLERERGRRGDDFRSGTEIYNLNAKQLNLMNRSPTLLAEMV
jgi:hypothetical protein